jgi:hypothetical protein
LDAFVLVIWAAILLWLVYGIRRYWRAIRPRLAEIPRGSRRYLWTAAAIAAAPIAAVAYLVVLTLYIAIEMFADYMIDFVRRYGRASRLQPSEPAPGWVARNLRAAIELIRDSERAPKPSGWIVPGAPPALPPRRAGDFPTDASREKQRPTEEP